MTMLEAIQLRTRIQRKIALRPWAGKVHKFWLAISEYYLYKLGRGSI
jgi:hypothetical protein